jgi:hypothetical protein
MKRGKGFQFEGTPAFIGWCGFKVEGDSFAVEGRAHLETCRKCAYENRQPPGMRGFVDLGSDIAWDDHGGKWGRKGHGGCWYVVRFDVADYDPSLKENDRFPYEAEVLYIGLDRFEDAATVKSALDCIGWFETDDALAGKDPDEQTIVEALVACGAYSIEWSDRLYNRPEHLRAEARRYVEQSVR